MQDLKIISREHMEKDKFYHDFAHAMGVYKNVQKLLEHEQGDEVSLLTAALFHDICRDLDNHDIEGAQLTKKILKETPNFPKDKIENITNLIKKHEKGQLTQDEKIFSDADKMEAFTMLGFARGLMMFADWKYTLKKSIETYLDLLEKWYLGFHFDITRELTEDDYKKLKVTLENLLSRYNP